jgi:anti-sigma factor RsiW
MQKTTARFSDEELMAYVDGEVGEENRRAIKAAAAANPEIAKTIGIFAQTRAMARAAFASFLQDAPRT